MKQIEAKRAQKGVQRQLDKDFFNNVGFQSSDKYYINQDRAHEAKSQVKGNAGKMSELIRAK